jgi:hypothetical protein
VREIFVHVETSGYEVVRASPKRDA